MNHALRLTTADPDAAISLLNGDERLVAESVRNGAGHLLDETLPVGLYVARVGRPHDFVETPIRLDRPVSKHLEGPPEFSIIPIDGAATSHEYYTYPLQDLTSRDTSILPGSGTDGRTKGGGPEWPEGLFESAGSRSTLPPSAPPGAPPGMPIQARLVLFVRGDAEDHPATGIQLHRGERLLCRLRDLPNPLEDTEHHSWGASMPVDSATRHFLFIEAARLFLPLDFVDRFQTVVLAERRDGLLVPEATRMFLLPMDTPFNPHESSSLVLERALDALHADTPNDLPGSVLDWILHPQDHRPTTTIACLLLLLLREDPAAAAVLRLFDVLARDLPPEHPDLLALEHLARVRLPGAVLHQSALPLAVPPSLRALWDQLCQADLDLPESWRRAHASRHTHVPISTWRPGTISRRKTDAQTTAPPTADAKPAVRGGSITAKKIVAENLVVGVQTEGGLESAGGFGEVRGGSIEADEIHARNVVSGLQILPRTDADFRVELTRLQNRLHQAAELGEATLGGIAAQLESLRHDLGSENHDFLQAPLTHAAHQLEGSHPALFERLKSLAEASISKP